jgi:hypothetical protein
MDALGGHEFKQRAGWRAPLALQVVDDSSAPRPSRHGDARPDLLRGART